MNDPVQVLENILGTIAGTSTTEAESLKRPDHISQLIKPRNETKTEITIDQATFYNNFYEGTKIYEEKNNFLFQSCAGRRLKDKSKYKSLLLANIDIPIFKDNSENPDRVTYELKSFIVYKGGSHYVCYFNNSGQWWYYNDLAADNKFTFKNNLDDITKEIDTSRTDYIILYNYQKA